MTSNKNPPFLNEMFVKKKTASQSLNTIKTRDNKKICWLLRPKNEKV